MEAPRRPILLVALAVYAGSALGARGTLPPEAARLFLLALALGLAGAWLAGARRLASAALLAGILASGSALRAGRLVRVDARAAGNPSLGPWRLVAERGDRELGSVGRGAPTLAIVRGTIGVGEEIAVLGDEDAPPLAEGPEPGPSRRLGSSRGLVERAPDEIVRLATESGGIAAWVGSPGTELEFAL